nr:hypothetical protein [Tanacetum cinerariifolium]
MKYEDIRPLFKRIWDQVHTFVPKYSEIEKEVMKRAGFDLHQGSSKKQRLDQQKKAEAEAQGDSDQAVEELKLYMRIIPEEDIAIEAIPLAIKPPVIIEYKIVKEGKISTYHITRADGSTRRYTSMINLIENIDREDLETFCKLVKDKYGNTRPEDGRSHIWKWGGLEENIKLTDTVPTPYDSPLTGVVYNKAFITLTNRVKKLESQLKQKRSSAVILSSDEEVLSAHIEDSPKQGRIIEEMDKDKNINLVSEQREVQETAEHSRDDDDETLTETLLNIKRFSAKDKGKGIMQETELAKKLKKKEMIQLSLDEELAQKLQLDQRKENIPKGDQAKEIDWNDPQILRYHALQNRPFSKVEVIKNMIMYLKNQEWYKQKKEVMKRAGFDLHQGSSKKQRLYQQTEEEAEAQGDSNQEVEELKLYMRIIPKEDISIKAIPLAIKPLVTIKSQETIGGTSAQTRSERVLKQPNEPPLPEGYTSGIREDKLEENIKLTYNVPTPYDSPLTGGYTHGSDEGRITLAELMETCTTLSNKKRNSAVILSSDEEVPSVHIEDSPKQGRIIEEMDKDKNINLVSEQGEVQETTEHLRDDYDETLTETLLNIKRSSAKDKGKGIMQETELPKKLKKKEMIQLSLDEKLAQKLFPEELVKKEVRQERERYNMEKAMELQRQLDQRKENVPKGGRVKLYMRIIPEEDIAIKALPRAIKPLVIIKYKIVKEGEISTYHITTADGSTRRYTLMINLLENIDREDLETLWKLVKDKYGNTRPEEGYERVLWGDLKVMFEPDIESEVWRKLQGHEVTLWKLFSSCVVHFVIFKNLHIFLRMDKFYPLTPATIKMMLERKLHADQ